MNKSESIQNLAVALSAFQGVLAGAKKTADNPFYKSKYADLGQIWETVRELLAKNGLSVCQVSVPSDSGTVAVETILMHASGEWISGITTLNLVKNDPQGAGSAITYARRYGLAAILGVHQEDDDANSHIKKPESPELKKAKAQAKARLKRILDAKPAGYDTPASITALVNRYLGVNKVDDCDDIDALDSLIGKTAAILSITPKDTSVHPGVMEFSQHEIVETPNAQSESVPEAIVQLRLRAEAGAEKVFTNNAHKKASIKKHLGVDQIQDCQDADLLEAFVKRLLISWKINNASELTDDDKKALSNSLSDCSDDMLSLNQFEVDMAGGV